MADVGTLVMQMVFCVLAVLLLGLVARDQTRRTVAEDDAAKALRSFITWWLVLAAYYFEQLLFNASRLFVDWTPNGLLAMTVFEAAFLVVAFGFLLDYLLYIVRGDIRWRRSILGYYAALFVLIAVMAPLTGPYQVVDDGMGPDLEANVPWTGVVAFLLLLVPVFAAVILLGTLFLKADEGKVRYRLGMLVAAVLVFLLAISIQGEVPLDIRWGRGDLAFTLQGGGVLIEGLLPLIGAWAAFRAYRPAAWVQVKLGMLHDADHPKAPLPPLERR